MPLSLTSQISLIVPAPTACTLAAAPPLNVRITINTVILLASALKIANNTKSPNETIYIVRRPTLSLNELHHKGNIDMLSMYTATLMFVTVWEAENAVLMSWSTGMTIALPIGAAMAQKATMNVRAHFVGRG